jgi:hypothetical protein
VRRNGEAQSGVSMCLRALDFSSPFPLLFAFLLCFQKQEKEKVFAQRNFPRVSRRQSANCYVTFGVYFLLMVTQYCISFKRDFWRRRKFPWRLLLVTRHLKFHFWTDFVPLESQENWWKILQKQPELEKNQFLVGKAVEEARVFRGCCHTNFSSNYGEIKWWVFTQGLVLRNWKRILFQMLRKEKFDETCLECISTWCHTCTFLISLIKHRFFYDFLMRESSFLIRIPRGVYSSLKMRRLEML